MDTFVVALEIAESGLVAYEHPEDNMVSIARPSSLSGTPFRGWDHDDVSGIGDAIIKINAPIGRLREIGKGKKAKYNVEISVGAAPGPGPEWINECFSTLDEAIDVVIECYFGNRINFNNPSLELWFGDKT